MRRFSAAFMRSKIEAREGKSLTFFRCRNSPPKIWTTGNRKESKDCQENMTVFFDSQSREQEGWEKHIFERISERRRFGESFGL
jgi:hypothetical protein